MMPAFRTTILAALALAGCAAADHAAMHSSSQAGPAYAPAVHWHSLAEGRQRGEGRCRW